jgi:translocation and assembly module TamB
MLAVLAPLALLAWLTLSEPGLRALASAGEHLSGGLLQIEGVTGTLAGRLAIDRLQLTAPGLRIEARKVALDWDPWRLAERRLEISELLAVDLRIANAESAEPLRPPASLSLPVAVRLERTRIARLAVSRLRPDGSEDAEPIVVLSDLEGSAASDGRLHRIESFSLAGPMGRLQLEGDLGGDPPFPLHSRVSLAGSRDGREFRLVATTNGTLEAFSATAEAEGFGLSGSAQIDAVPFAPVPLSRIQAHLPALNPAVVYEGAPQARLAVTADLRPVPSAAPRDWILVGPVSLANGSPGPLDRNQLPVQAASALLRWQAGKLSVSDLDVSFPGAGSGRGSADWDGRILNAKLALAGIDMKMLVSTLKPTKLAGTIEAGVDAGSQWVKARLREPRFQASFEASHSGGTVALDAARIEARGASLTARGRLGLEGNRTFDLRGELAGFDPSLYAELPKARLNAVVLVRGRLQPGLRVETEFTLRDSVLTGKPLDGRGRVVVSPDRLEQSDLALDFAGNRVTARGGFGRAGDRLELSVQAPRLGVLGHGIEGSVTATALLSGTLARPAADLELTATGLRLPGAQRLEHLDAKAIMRDGADGRVEAEANVRGWHAPRFEEALIQQARLEVKGTRREHVLNMSGRMGGGREFVAQASGGLVDGPGWSGALNELKVTGKPSIGIAAPVALQLSAKRVAVGAAELHVDAWRIQHAQTVWTPESLATRGRFTGLPVGLGLDPERGLILAGDGLKLGGEWDLRLADQVDGMARIFREAGDLALTGDSPVDLGLDRLQLRLNAEENRLAWSLDAAGRRMGELSGAGTALAERANGGWRLVPDAPLAGSVRAAVPSIDWIGPFLSHNLRTGGGLRAEFSITGSAAAPRGEGTVRGEGLSVSLIEQGTRLTDGQLLVSLDQDRIRLERLELASITRVKPREARIDFARLTAQPGRVRASGELQLASGRGTLQVEADRVSVLQHPDQWVMVSGRGNLVSTAGALTLEGQVKADAGYWELAQEPAPSLSDDVIVKGRRKSAGRGGPLSVDLLAQLGDSFYFQGRGLETRLTGEIRIRSDGTGPLRATGSIRTRGGTFDAYGQRLTITRGIVNFLGPLDNPGLNVLAVRKGLPVEAGVSVTGTVLNPKVALYSDPNVPDPEKLSWMINGRPLEAGGTDAALLLAAAGAILGNQTEGVSKQLTQSLGIDDFSITSGDLKAGPTRMPASTVASGTSSTRNVGVASQIVRVGKRLSANAYLSFEQSLVGASAVVALTYRLTRQLSVIARAGADNAVDLLYTIAFD